MTRERIKIEMTEQVERGKPEFSGDGKTLSSIVVRCHPDDRDEVVAKVKDMLRQLGATNIQREFPS